MIDLSQTHILLGKAKRGGDPVWHLIIELLKHVLLLGRTGAGKTTLLYWIVAQLINRCGIWLFDRKKDFRHLLRVFPDEILVFDVMQDFKCNPLQPPPYSHPKTWASMLTWFYCKVYNFLDVGQSMMFTELHKLYEQRGVYDGSTDYPSFLDLLERIKALKLNRYSNLARTQDSLCSRIEMLLAMTGSCYDCCVGYALEDFKDKTVVLEGDSVMESTFNFMVNYFLAWLFCYRIGKGERGNILRNLVIFDEAKAVFSPFENATLGFDPIVFMVSMLREFGVGIVAADQTAQLNNAIFANSQLKVLFSLGSGEDLVKAARSMGLSAEQAAFTRGLGVGEAVMRDQRINKTFVVEIPIFPLE
jgi:hypothetical protein